MIPFLNKILVGDVRDSLRQLPNESISTCVTSPPYYGLRDYGIDGQIGLEETPQEYINKLVEVFQEVKRVLRKDGTLWLNLGDSYAANRTYQVHNTKGAKAHTYSKGSKVPEGMKQKDLIGIPWMAAFALRGDGWYLRQDIIWAKNAVMPESVEDRCTKCHEYIFLLSKSPKYYFDAKSIKEPATSPTPKVTWKSRKENGEPLRQGINREVGKIAGGFGSDGFRNKRSVWNVNPKPFREAHFATFPPDLITPCILAGSPLGGVVLDPFMGAGTTGLVSVRHGRNYIGCELNPEYVKIAEKRIRNERLDGLI